MAFAGRSALVTGAGSGIGQAASVALAAKGAYVLATDFDEPSANRTAEMIVEAGGRAEAFRLAVQDEAEWEAVLSTSDELEDRLAILVNCAGKAASTSTFSMPLEDFKDIMATNVEGTFLGMKLAVPRIAESGGGAVINISSQAGLKGIAGMTAYCGSKGAIRLMTKAVALECGALRNKVRVNSLHPGVVDTPQLRRHMASGQLSGLKPGEPMTDAEETIRARVPIGVFCTPEEVAATICFLASDDARHITGAEIAIDGGMTAG
jgi:NAD(P)-dependent dehydrogenase (short-subunit alcohol dehydrogenase family)